MLSQIDLFSMFEEVLIIDDELTDTDCGCLILFDTLPHTSEELEFMFFLSVVPSLHMVKTIIKNVIDKNINIAI